MVRPNLYFTIEKNIIEPRINPGLDFLFLLYQDKRKGKTRRVYFLLFHLPFDTSCGLLRVRGKSGGKDLSTLFLLLNLIFFEGRWQ